MKKYQLRCFVSVSLLCPFVWATALATPCYWKGFYVGETAGGVFSRYHAKTSTQPGAILDGIQANAVNRYGHQIIKANGFLTGIEGGYNWQFNHLVFGLETDIQSLSSHGETNSGAVVYPNQANNQFVITSYGNNNWLFTARPRIGWVVNNFLFYATGGLGLTYLQSNFVFTSNQPAFETRSVSQVRPGYVFGAGVEANVTNHISLKTEYLFTGFNHTRGNNVNSSAPANQHFANSVNLRSNIVRVGINYHFDNQSTLAPNLALFPGLFNVCDWNTEVGARLFFSTGRAGAPQPLFGDNTFPLYSRLVFSHLSGVSGETFARADHVSGIFLKGYLGAGTVKNGRMNDEDFPAGDAYSNTRSHAAGNLSYATIDLGYSFIDTPTGKVGPFVGYNYNAQNYKITSCKQMAGSLVCVPTSELQGFLVLSEDDKFDSLRLGLSTQLNLTDKLTLTSDAAYLPLIGFKGTDIHVARQLIGPERSSRGSGAMLESVLDYQFADSWSVGVGGRYWTWNMRSGSVGFDFLGEGVLANQPARFTTERYGAFLQLNYRDKNSSHCFCSAPINWKGIFVGGHLGGAWGKSYWSDPFGSTATTGTTINVAGFGDRVRATGPFGGVDLNVNWQTCQLVYGIGGSFSATDMRGDNTLFSGLGGVNGQTIAKYLGTIFGRVGLATDRSLFYVNAGPALLRAKYSVNANTGVLTLGSQSCSKRKWGWTAGVGVECALSDCWTSNVEYDYVRISRHTIAFPSVAQISDQKISVRQTMNVFKIGFNYKLAGF